MRVKTRAEIIEAVIGVVAEEMCVDPKFAEYSSADRAAVDARVMIVTIAMNIKSQLFLAALADRFAMPYDEIREDFMKGRAEAKESVVFMNLANKLIPMVADKLEEVA